MVSVAKRERITAAVFVLLGALWLLNGVIPQSPEDKALEWQMMGFLSGESPASIHKEY